MLDRELSRLGIEASGLPGYGTQASGHLHVAAAIAAGAGCADDVAGHLRAAGPGHVVPRG
ncbi:MAG TPA: hypothetical protein VJ254_04880 [Streptosporangiaceae bacterium]|nr:hypothetical protein [Streptosporangiaceae bacterium]